MDVKTGVGFAVMLSLTACAGLDETEPTDGAFVGTTAEALHTTLKGPRAVAGTYPAPLTVVTDATSAYWITGDNGSAETRIYKAPKLGGNVPTLIADLGMDPARGLALADGTLYWATSTRIGSVKLDGAGLKTLVSGTVTAGLAVDETHVYFATFSAVRRVPRGGGEVFQYTGAGFGIRELVLDATHIYMIEGSPSDEVGRIWRMDKRAGSPTVIATDQADPRWLHVVGESVYWGNEGLLGDEQADVEIRAMPKTGGAITTLREVGTNFTGMVVDATHIYWSEGRRGNVRRITLAGTGTTYAVTNEHATRALAADGTGVIYGEGAADDDGAQLWYIPRDDVRGSVCSATADQAAAVDSVFGMSQTGTWIYWSDSDNGLIGRVWRNGSSRTELVAFDDVVSGPIVADFEGVYWLGGGGLPNTWAVKAYPQGSLEIETILTDDGIGRDFAYDGDTYFAVEDGGEVWRGTATLDSQELLTQVDGSGHKISLSTTYVYVGHRTLAGAAAVSRVSKFASPSTSPTLLFTSASPRTPLDVLYDASFVYFIYAGQTTSSLVRFPSSGGSSQFLWSSTLSRPTDMKAQGSFIYMSTNIGEVIRVPKAGGAAEILADRPGVSFELDGDGTCISFGVSDNTTGAGELVKVAD